MHDKVVRRRRAVLAVLVLLSLFLLTAYFGEGNGGALHGMQPATGGLAEVGGEEDQGADDKQCKHCPPAANGLVVHVTAVSKALARRASSGACGYCGICWCGG